MRYVRYVLIFPCTCLLIERRMCISGFIKYISNFAENREEKKAEEVNGGDSDTVGMGSENRTQQIATGM